MHWEGAFLYIHDMKRKFSVDFMRRTYMKKIFLLLPILIFIAKILGKTTSVIIPCHYTHVQFLEQLLVKYELQTELPNEVVISISESHKANGRVIKELQAREWKFPVKFLVTRKRQFAGTNRNIACRNASGEILITQDADDIPHPQRVEVIKYFFGRYNLDHLMHQWVFESKIDNSNFYRMYSMASIPFKRLNHYGETWKIGYFHNGNIAISKKLFKRIGWSCKRSGQDVEYNRKVYSLNGIKHLVLKVPLIIYNRDLSTQKLRESRKVTTRASNLNFYEI